MVQPGPEITSKTESTKGKQSELKVLMKPIFKPIKNKNLSSEKDAYKSHTVLSNACHARYEEPFPSQQ